MDAEFRESKVKDFDPSKSWIEQGEQYVDSFYFSKGL